MADIGNQLEGVEGGLERFLDALDNASVKLGSNSALESRIAREELKRLDQEKRFKMKIEKMEKTRLKQIADSVKSMKQFNKSLGDMGKGMLKGIGNLGKSALKGGAIGGLVIAVKFLIDGLFKVDNAMAALSKRTSMTRSELQGVGDAATNVSLSLTKWGVTLEQAYAEAGNLVEQFGSAHWVSEQLITDSLALQKGYGLAAEQAGALTEALERSGRAGADFRASVEAISGKVGVSASLVMRDLASRAQQIAIQSERGTEALARMAAKALETGTSLQDWSGIKTAFSDIGNIQDTLAKGQRIFGSEFVEIMGTAEELARLNVKGAKGREEIMNRIQKAMKATTVDLGKGGIMIKHSGKLMEDLELHVEGMANGLGGTLEALSGFTRDLPKASREVQSLNDRIASGKSLIEIMKDGVIGIAGGLSTTFSQAMGLASDNPDGPRAQTQAFIDFVTEKFKLEDLGKATKGKGAAVYFETLLNDVLKPIFDDIGKALGKAIGAGISDAITDWKRNNAWADWLLPDTEKEDILEDMEDLQKHMDRGTKRTGVRGQGKTRKFTEDEMIEMQRRMAAMELSAGITGTPAQEAVALADAALLEEKYATGKLFRPGKDISITASEKALGGFGGLSVVGEAGGEVVVSRSALRSGIGVGGRAASALAGIGVPGFQNGGVVRSTRAAMERTGEQGAFGSQSYKLSGAVAVQKEIATQQAAMLAYWRNTYDEKMDALVEGVTVEKPKGPPWLATFFLKYNKEIGAQLKKANAGPELEAAFMQGMTKWAQGGSLSDAMKVGARAGIVAGINDPNSKLNEYLKQTGEWQGTLTAGLASIAQGGSFKSAGRAMVQKGMMSLLGDSGSTAAKYLGMGGGGGIRGQLSGMIGAAKGKYVNSPTLMMVGEEGRGEVVVPTERIRKGLPINAGVARELGSIGVPGFGIGALLSGFSTGRQLEQQGLSHNIIPQGGMKGYGMGVGTRFEGMGGFGGMAKAGGAGALMSFGNVLAETGDWKRAGTAGIGAGLGVGMGMGLSALGVPPPLSGMIGNALGGLATKGLNKVFNLTGGYGKGRRRSVKLIEDHIKTGGRFDHGAPGGLRKAMNQAIGGYEKTPTEANFQKLVEKLGTSKMVASMGVPAPALIALGTGQTSGGAATKMYGNINRALYGTGGDKYRKALAIPSLAAGGIVNRPTTAVIGEAGPEAVVPLGNSEMMQELKKQNKLMAEMIKTQKETGTPEIRMDGKLVSEVVGKNFYQTGLGM